MLGFWWLTHPEKCEFVIWDDDIPNLWKKMFQTTDQIIWTKHVQYDQDGLIINNVGGYSTTMLLCPEIAER
jgi:hypothetical protein